MLDLDAAKKIALSHIRGGRVNAVRETDNLYILQIFTNSPDEGQMDPFYSVDKKTGAFSGFSMFLDKNFELIRELFKAV